MQKVQKICLSVVGVTAALTTAVVPVSAQTMQRQHQSFSSETSFSSSCEGSKCGGKVEFKSSTDMHQSQQQQTGMSRHGGWDQWEDEKHNTNGEVKLTWSMRDGTCYIQYRMVGQTSWPYSTQADCNEGSKTIGGLEEGKNYQFRIKKNDGRWSRLMTRRAE